MYDPKMTERDEKIVKLSRECKVPLCKNNREEVRYPFCLSCMFNTVKRFVKLMKQYEPNKHEADSELANRAIRHIQENWVSLVEAEKFGLSKRGLAPEEYE